MVHLHIVELRLHLCDVCLHFVLRFVRAGAKQVVDREIKVLRDAEDDSMLQQTLLMGSLQSQHPELPRTIASLRRIGSSRPDSLALLLLARNGEQLSPSDLQQLGRISAGGGQLTDTLQIQAAWLYLKHTDGLQAALVRLTPAD